MRKVELMPLEQRKLTFDSHALVKELESSGMVTIDGCVLLYTFRNVKSSHNKTFSMLFLLHWVQALRKGRLK